MDGNIKQEDNREYTIKIIPHQGETVHSVRVPFRVLKYGLASLCAGAVLFVGALSFATYSAFTAKDDADRMAQLKKVNTLQQEQLTQLAKKANTLQDQMDEVREIEQELQMVSGLVAPEDAEAPTESFDGQGGPWIEPNPKNVNIALDNISHKLDVTRSHMDGIREAIKEQQKLGSYHTSYSAEIPSIWPSSGDVSSPYGMRWGGSDFHPGIDIANDYDTPIVATADGVVTFAGYNSGGYGNMVDIDHGNGLTTRYGHAEEVVVEAGQAVRRGQIIAFMGSTGFSTGPHVHYEVRVNGEVVNPENYLW